MNCGPLSIVNLRKRPTSETRGPQTVGVFKQHNTAHDISKEMSFILNHKALGILIGTLGCVFQTGLNQFFAFLVSHRSNGLHCPTTDRFNSIRGH